MLENVAKKLKNVQTTNMVYLLLCLSNEITLKMVSMTDITMNVH